MANSGMLRGSRGASLSYTPILTSDGKTPINFGTGVMVFGPTSVPVGAWGIYSIVPAKNGADYCVGHADFVWGASAPVPPTGQFQMSLPVPIRRPADTATGDFFLGAGMWGQALGIHDTPLTVYSTFGTDSDGLPGLPAPAWCHGVVGRYATAGTATIANATQSIVVAHGMGLAPQAVTVTPSASPSASGLDMNHCWVDTITATQFTIHGQTAAAGNLTAAQGFTWHADQVNAQILSGNTPIVFGANADHILIYFMYPTA